MKKLLVILCMAIFLIGFASAFSSTLQDHLLAYYDFEDTGSTLTDTHNGIYNGTGQGTIQVSQPGLIGNSWNLTDGGWINITTEPWYAASNFNFTWSAWVNMTTQNAQHSGTVIGAGQKQAGVSSPFFRNYIAPFPNLHHECDAVGISGGDIVNMTLDVTAGIFEHVVVTGDGTHVRLYLNGTEIGKVVISGDPGFNASSIGGLIREGYVESNLTGHIDEVAIYNRTLNISEIEDLWNGGSGFNPLGDTILNITLNAPPNNTKSIAEDVNFNFTIDPTNVELTNATLKIWNSTDDLYYNITNNITGILINESFFENVNITVDTYTFNLFACSNVLLNNSGSCVDSENYTYTKLSYSVDNIQYANSTYDTDAQEFILNISVVEDADLFSATLVYNGTSYLASTSALGGGNYTIRREIDIPVVSTQQNHTFNWTLTFDVGAGFTEESTAELNVSVLPSDMLNQEGSMNFTLFNEDDLTKTGGTFEATFTWYLGNGTVTKNKSFDLSAAHEFLFNTTPFDDKMFVSSEILIANNTNQSQFGDRFFQFNKDEVYNTSLATKELLFANETRSRQIIIEVKDTGLSPLENIFVTVQRFYPELGYHKTVENRETDNFGQFSGKFIENDVTYRFEFRDANNTLLKTEESISISCRATICVLPFVIDTSTDEFDRFRNATGFDWTFTFDNNTNIFEYTWNDVTGNLDNVRLEITRYLFNGTTVVYNQTSAANPGTLSYNVGTVKASYIAQIFRTVDGKEVLVAKISTKVGDLTDTFGVEGLLWSFFLLMTLVAVGTFSPPVGIVLYLVGFILLGVLDIVYIHPAILIAEIVLGVLFIWAFRS